MYNLSFSSKFKRDYKTIVKRGYSINMIVNVFNKEIKLVRTGTHSDLF